MAFEKNEKLNAASLEGIHYEYKYNPEFKRYDIEFEIDDNCDQRILDFIENLYQKSKGSNFQLDAIQDNKQRQIIELLLNHKPASNTNRPISAEIKIHEAKFSIKIISKKNTLTDAQKIELIRYWEVPTLPNHFIGRQQLLAQLAERLDPKKNETSAVVITACHGLGGIGKTFLAVQYAQTQRDKYAFILWFNAENNETLYRGYYDFATAIQLPIEHQSPENVIAIVKNWLEQHPIWLIIYDNAPDDKLIAKYRPANGGEILITSRKESWGKKESLAIDVFTIDEARDYIVELTGFALSEHQVAIDELAKTLGYLPLALAQACAYIAVNNLSLEDYLALYADSRAEMLADKTMPAEISHEPVAVTWHITFEAIKKQQLTASTLLESCAFLQGSSISEFLLKELFAKQQPGLANQTKSFIDVMGCLKQYSMLKNINNTQKDKTFSMHNLVQEVIVETLSNEEKRTYLIELIKLLKIIFPYQEIEQLEDFAKQRSLLPHLEKGLQRAEEWINQLKKDQSAEGFLAVLVQENQKKLYVCLLELIAHGYSNLGDARRKKELLEQALVIQERHYGKDHPEMAVNLHNLANAVRALGDARKARELLEQALVIQEQRYVKDHREISRTLGDLANSYKDLGDARKAKELQERVLGLQERQYGKDHPMLALTLNNLATTYGELGDARKARELLEQALVIQEKHYGKDHPHAAHTLNNLATAYGSLGNACKQKALLERALVIEEKHYGKDHPEVAHTLGNLANALGALGEAGQQKALLERVLMVEEQHYGKNHPEVARILVNLATAYGSLGDAHKQKELLERALIVKEQHYGKDHPGVARTLGNLATAYGSLGDAHKQKELLERVLPIFEQHYGKEHPEVARTIDNLATVVGVLGNMRKAKELQERVLVILEQHYGKEHPEVAVTLNNLANTYGALGEACRQKELLERVLVIKGQHYGKNHPEVARTLSNLAVAYGKLGDAHQEKELLEQALVIQEQYYRKDHPEVASVLYNLTFPYISLGEWPKAKSMAEHAYHIFSAHPNAGLPHPHTQIAKAQLDKLNMMLATFSPEQLSVLHSHGKISVTEKNSPDLAKALRNAANQNNVEKLKELLPQEIDVNAKDEGQYGRTALHWAVIKQAYPCIKLLLIAGADPMMVDKTGKSSVDYAGENPIPDALFLLLSHHYKLSLDNIDAGKMLRRAAYQNKVNDIELLLRHVKNVNEKDTGNTQRTVLHWAVIQEATDCIEALIIAGADPTIVDASGKTARDYAKGNKQIMELLQRNASITKMQQK